MAKEEVVQFYLSGPKYLQQAGEAYPRYINASPTVPVIVTLPAKVLRGGKLVDQPEGQFMKRVPPEKPKPAHAVVKQDLVRKANEVFVEGARAADQ